MRKLLYLSIALNLVLALFFVLWFSKPWHWHALKQSLGLAEKQAPSNYYQIKSEIFASLPITQEDIVFVGNSITDYAPLDELFKNISAKNRGIGGDDIGGITQRISSITQGRPRKIFLLIGTNDLESEKNMDTLALRYARLVQQIKSDTPQSELYLLSVLPTRNVAQRPNALIQELNGRIQELAEKNNAVYIKLFPHFLNKRGELHEKYSLDGIHLNAEGYRLWAKILEDFVY